MTRFHWPLGSAGKVGKPSERATFRRGYSLVTFFAQICHKRCIFVWFSIYFTGHRYVILALRFAVERNEQTKGHQINDILTTSTTTSE